ncbi:Leucine-rich repeat receptor-like protein kinase pxc1 [Thalictrum thalictroides]|uniref:Leucine-rich repeat receptor-like protein kinase pxc1 n=1 Tax=Thalictrum thalictroides TaxID=46969 RepID=A0A7J6WSP7_THATH|nr:Leucine-rich repeat receptor-like protein kinase pxc1 [Thalictrum thalictroides]
MKDSFSFLVSLLLLLFFVPFSKSDLTSDKNALLAIQSTFRPRSIKNWNSTDSSPCRWQGVECENNRVTVLRLPGLRTLSLRLNALTGQLPSDLSLCVDLRNLYLQGNSLHGCPLDACPKGKKKLSGGAIAGIAIGVVIGFLLLLLILFICCRKKSSGKSKQVDIASAKHPSEVEAVGKKTVENVNPRTNEGVAVKTRADLINSGDKKLVFFGNATRYFDLEDLLRASAEVLGNGTFGTAYKAMLELGNIVAVKRLKDVTIPEQEFRNKIEIVGSMDHINLVPLRAYYYSRDEKLLVCDYMHMGSLSALLHGNRGAGRTPLNWETRSGIALGAARGIEYLHLKGPSVSHGNIKSSNILLTNLYDARVSDFGLAHLVGPSATPNRITGYRAPEVTDARRVSQKADVYSFGVLLLELLTGKAPSHALLNEEGVDLPRWVQSVVREEWTSEVFDQELLRYQNVEEDMVQLLQLAVDCVAQYPDKRPSMSEVVHRIEELCRSSPGPDQRDLYDDELS